MSDAYILRRRAHAARARQGRWLAARGLDARPRRHRADGAIKARNELDGPEVDDVILGCVDPVGEAGGDIARAGALAAGFGDSVPGVQINRFCASGLDAVNFAAAQVMSGQHDLAIGGGVESMSRVGIGASGGAWPVDPAIAIPSYFMPQGVSADLIATKYGFSRDDVDAYAVRIAEARRAAPGRRGVSSAPIVPVKDVNGLVILDTRRTSSARHGHAVAGGAKALLHADGRRWAASTRWRSRRIRKSRASIMCITPAIRRASSTARRRCWSAQWRRASG